MKQTLSLVLDPHAKLFHYVNKSGGVYDLTKKAMSGSNDGYVRKACGRHVGGACGRHVGGMWEACGRHVGGMQEERDEG